MDRDDKRAFFSRLRKVARELERERGGVVQSESESVRSGGSPPRKRPREEQASENQQPSQPPAAIAPPEQGPQPPVERRAPARTVPRHLLLCDHVVCVFGFGTGKLGSRLENMAQQLGATCVDCRHPSGADVVVAASGAALADGLAGAVCSAEWLRQCFVQEKYLSPSLFPWEGLPAHPRLDEEASPAGQAPPKHRPARWGGAKARCVSPGVPDNDSSHSSVEDEDFDASMPLPVSVPHGMDVRARRGAFACSQANAEGGRTNKNEHITRHLEPLVAFYKAEGDQWREYAHKRAIGMIRALDVKITHADQCRMRGIGSGIQKKVAFILEHGYLDRTQERQNDPRAQALLAFSQIHGVGSKGARDLVRQGFTSVEDLRQRGRHLLTDKQQIGLDLHEDFRLRIPREEGTVVFNRVKEAITEFFGGHQRCAQNRVEIVCCGSYRRGLDTSGDIDVLVSHRSPTLEMFTGLLDHLRHAQPILTHSLTTPKSAHHGSFSFLGVCRVLPQSPHRRIDIKLYPRTHFAFALLYFTGDDYFNRSMRYYAHKQGWTLSDHGLKPCTRVGTERVSTGLSVVCHTERDIFRALGLEFKEPQQRNCYLQEAMVSAHEAGQAENDPEA